MKKSHRIAAEQLATDHLCGDDCGLVEDIEYELEIREDQITKLRKALEATSNYLDELLLLDEQFPGDWNEAHRHVKAARDLKRQSGGSSGSEE